MLRHNLPRPAADPGPSPWQRWMLPGAVIVVCLTAIGVAALFVGSVTYTIQCDGSVPTWMVPADYDNGGCVRILDGEPPADWDGSWICLGLCDVPNPSPYFPDQP